MYKLLLRTIFFIVFFATTPLITLAANEIINDTEYLEKAKVVEVHNQESEVIPGTETKSYRQRITAYVLEGKDHGRSITFENDYIQLKPNDVFFLRHITNEFDGTDLWSVADPYRLNTLIVLAFIFVALIFIFGGIQGVRGLGSLIGSIVLIFSILIPGIFHGYSPILMSIGVASLIIIIGSYITHGFNRTTSAAIIGMLITVAITGIGAYWVIHHAELSGFSNEESVYLNFNAQGSIDMLGLLFGGIMIGLLGVLYDIAIGQAVSVEELKRANPHIKQKKLYLRALRIGREHIGALVNTLAIAYVGAFLPLLLITQQSHASLLYILNSELFATEIIRILIGGIGLILAVPITTLISVRMIHKISSLPPSDDATHHSHTLE